jgi:hypothetical protein
VNALREIRNMSVDEHEKGRQKGERGDAYDRDASYKERDGYLEGLQYRAKLTESQEDLDKAKSIEWELQGEAVHQSAQASRVALGDFFKKIGADTPKARLAGLGLLAEDMAIMAMLPTCAIMNVMKAAAISVNGDLPKSGEALGVFLFSLLFGMFTGAIPFMLYRRPKFRAASLYAYPVLWALLSFLTPSFLGIDFKKILWTLIIAAASYGLHLVFLKGCAPKAARK